MATGKRSERPLGVHTCRIPLRLPGLNEYTEANRRNRYEGAKIKRQIQADISWFLQRLPAIKKPVKVSFLWSERANRRDPDNVAFAQKFILDTLVKLRKIPNDNGTWIKGLYHDFEYGGEDTVTIRLEEICEELTREETSKKSRNRR